MAPKVCHDTCVFHVTSVLSSCVICICPRLSFYPRNILLIFPESSLHVCIYHHGTQGAGINIERVQFAAMKARIVLHALYVAAISCIYKIRTRVDPYLNVCVTNGLLAIPWQQTRSSSIARMRHGPTSRYRQNDWSTKPVTLLALSWHIMTSGLLNFSSVLVLYRRQIEDVSFVGD